MKADLIIKNGKVFSREKGDCIAIKDGKLLTVGSRQDMEQYEGISTKVIDAEGNSVIPGFIDSHLHASSCTELYKTKLMYNFDRKAGESRESYIERMMAELKIYCDENRVPTGLFKEMQAIEMVFDNFQGADFSVEEYKEGIMAFQRDYALPSGIMGIFDAYASSNAITAYRELASEGMLKIRVRTAILADPGKDDSQFDAMIAEKGRDDVGDDFRITTVKFFCDAGDFGFYMNEPFEKELLRIKNLPKDYRGESQWEAERMGKAVLKLSKAGFQIHVHCMGDAAVKHTLDAFEYADSKGVKGNRNAIAHIMSIDSGDISRMKKLGVIASMQPSWPIYDGFSENCSVPLFGKERVLKQYPLGSIKKAGVVIASGTDFPVLTIINPFIGIQVGATRTSPKSSPDYEEYKGIICGPKGNETVDCMSLDHMLESYSLSGAYQMFLEDVTGSIECGKSADLLILDRNLGTTDIMDVEDTGIKYRVFKGQIL